MQLRILVAIMLAAGLLASGGPAAAEGFEFGQRGLRWSSANETVHLRTGGRLHADAFIYDDDLTPLDDSGQLRRLRLFLSGGLFKGVQWQDVRFKIEGELAPKRIGWRNLYATYRGIENTEIRLGQFVAPQLFEDLMSSNDLMFMERSLAAALAPRFRAGGTIGYWQRQWSVRAGGFGDSLNGDNFDATRADGPSFTGRVTGAPWRRKRQVLHLGASVTWRDVDETESFRVRSRPESAGAERLVDTGNLLGVDTDLTVGAELAAVWGPVALQGEYLHKFVEINNAADPEFHGGYVQLSWFPTGESRRYSSRRAVFREVVPKRKWGAVELALRYSGLDLTDAGIRGGDEQNVSVGINWYFLRNFRLMFNYIHVDANVRNTLAKDRPNIFQFRFQASI